MEELAAEPKKKHTRMEELAAEPKKKRRRMEESATEQKKNRIQVIPWMREPIDISEAESWPLNGVPFIDARLVTALGSMGITSLFPVQVAAWHETIGPGSYERDICINSPTGSGKTLAYALPIVQMLSTRLIKRLQALVVLPTHGLAVQVKSIFDALAPAVGLSVGLAVGQSSIDDEISELIERPTSHTSIFDSRDFRSEPRSKVDILVATPGRLMDHINNTEGFTLEHLCYLVVDEVDRLLNESYQSWLPTVLKLAHSSNESQFLFGSLRTIRSFGVERGFKDKPYPRLAKMILSATLTQDPSKLAQLDLHHPLLLTTGGYKLPEQLKSMKVVCKTSKLKPVYLLALLEKLQGEKCIVFTSSVESTNRLYTLLNLFHDLPIKIKEYSRRQPQSIRSKTLRAFRAGEIQVLICSDAMARGMDVEGVKNVINYDMPEHIKNYIHRAGRTARAGQAGRCFTFLHKHEVNQFKKLLQKADNESCPLYNLPSESVESFHHTYTTALEKLKESVDSERYRKGKVRNKQRLGVTRKKEKAV